MMLRTNLTQEFKNDPFETWMKRYEQDGTEEEG
jgi:hypothetical protein